MTKIMQKFTQNDITHLFAAQKYIQFVCFPFALLLSEMCVPCSFSFIVLYGYYGYYGYFCSNTDFHGISRNFIHQYPCFSV